MKRILVLIGLLAVSCSKTAPAPASAGQSGSTAQAGQPATPAPAKPVPQQLPDVIARVKKGMEQVVNSETGTGRLARIPAISAAGKTGTAQTSKGPPHAWFGGYAPIDHPKISFIVFLENGGHGGVEAALVARDMLVYLHELGYI